MYQTSLLVENQLWIQS